MNLEPLYIHIPTERALTSHLTAEQFGAYQRLRLHRWAHGVIPEESNRQAGIVGTSPERWTALQNVILPLLDKVEDHP